jgi:hypothetical protein
VTDQRTKSAVWITDIYSYGQGHLFADQVHEGDKPEESRLLGPDGKPLRYAKPPMGFDLRPREGDA